jgi:hypothetical protein
MSEIVVTCPDCGLRAKVTHKQQQIIDLEKTCKHRPEPTNCLMLGPALSFARQSALADRQSGRRGPHGPEKNVAAMDELQKARQRFSYVQALVANQRRILERLKWEGADTRGAEQTLTQYEQSERALGDEVKKLEKGTVLGRRQGAPGLTSQVPPRGLGASDGRDEVDFRNEDGVECTCRI